MLDAVVPVFVEQAARARRPAGDQGTVGGTDERERDPERGPRREPRLAAGDRQVVRAGQDLAALGLVAGEVLGERLLLEIGLIRCLSAVAHGPDPMLSPAEVRMSVAAESRVPHTVDPL